MLICHLDYVTCFIDVNYIYLISQYIQLFSTRDKNSSSNIKIDTLCFVNILLTNHCPVVFHPHVDALVPVSPLEIVVLCNWIAGLEPVHFV